MSSMPLIPSEERLALYIDFENVALGARDIGHVFEIAPLLDALAERGRLIVRRAYADWNLFKEFRRDLVDANIELIEIPQRSDIHRKNAADIKLAVDAMELAAWREFVSTFVIVSGDSDFTPLVSKLRELNRRVIGVGVKGSTSALLPPVCDEFIFYDRLETVLANTRSRKGNGQKKTKEESGGRERQDLQELLRLISRTLAGLQGSSAGPVLGSTLKRALLRKDPTFNESDYGFRAFRELLKHLESLGHVELHDGTAPGDPEVEVPEVGGSTVAAFELLRDVVVELTSENGKETPLSGLKDQLRKRDNSFSEKDHGYAGFLQFCKGAAARGIIQMDYDAAEEEYFLYVPS